MYESTEQELRRRMAERNAYMQPLIEAHERQLRSIWIVMFNGLFNLTIPRLPDIKEFRV